MNLKGITYTDHLNDNPFIYILWLSFCFERESATGGGVICVGGSGKVAEIFIGQYVIPRKK